MSAPQKSRFMSSENSDDDNAPKKVMSECTIDGLKEKTVGISNNKLIRNDSPESSETTVNIKDKKEQLPEISVNLQERNFRIISKTNAKSLYYPKWENISNLCWLDASMILVSHNHTLRYKTNLNGSAQILKIIKFYNEATCFLNDVKINPEVRLNRIKELLISVQQSSLNYLQPFLKNNKGEPESAFCALFNLLSENTTIKKYFEVKFTRSLFCQKCHKKKVNTQSKTIITLSKVRAFQPSLPTAQVTCPACKNPEQNMVISYENLPKCLVFHFEGGAGQGEWENINFNLKGREYKVTGLMTLEKASETTTNHFVSWIKEPVSNYWLECNDLKPKIEKFSEVPPEYIKLEKVYIIMFESFDDLGTLDLSKAPVDANENFNLEDDDDNISVIDLSEDLEESSTAYDCEPGVSNNDIKDSVVANESHQSSDKCFKDTPLLYPESRKSSRKRTNIFTTKYKSFVSDFGTYSESKIDSTKNKTPQIQSKRKVSVNEILISKTENVEQTSSESIKKKYKKIE